MKEAVDDAIDQCSEIQNVRESIEISRGFAEDATDEKQKQHHISQGSRLVHQHQTVFDDLLKASEISNAISN